MLAEGYPLVLDLEDFYRQNGAWPAGRVVVPRDQDDLRVALDVARSENAPLLARGAGCGVETICARVTDDPTAESASAVISNPRQRKMAGLRRQNHFRTVDDADPRG